MMRRPEGKRMGKGLNPKRMILCFFILILLKVKLMFTICL
jgi:hypothetical protein